MAKQNFGRIAEIMTGNMSFALSKYTMEGSVPFDNDALPNESELRVWNLAQTTINNIKRNGVLMLNAGYTGDIGIILHGRISAVRTRWEGVDKVTTINVLDSEDLSKREVTEIAFAKGTLASAIIKQMAGYIGLPVAQMQLYQDYRYQEGYTAKGKVTDIITEVCKDCRTSCFINQSKLYVRNLRSGADAVFALSPDTGLIGSPEFFEDNGIKGYKIQAQLQRRITTASVINLTCREFSGRLHVRGGSHKFSNTGDFITEVEAVL
ncbi:phage protein [Paenibacillus sp. sgz500992]|uniref:phage protein n=1 Tax=Paenibacillus sp. sgz500992 TaxID=3242476 RepID=UPI0036D278CA